MKREFRITADGSHTLYVPELDESYHSVHGAIQESGHVFIAEGFRMMHKSPLRILEIGFGTGLNAMLTLAEAGRSGTHTFYHAVENYPLIAREFAEINHEQFVDGIDPGSLVRMHTAPWGEWIRLTDRFTLFKERADFREMDPQGTFDLVYFDAFAPDKQPHLWTGEIFCRLYQLLNPGGMLVTYASKGSVRRDMASCGFQVEKVPGPPGKREMTRAIKR
jgi:tRNA U34 5-methylaminomethyl-2-thiouridine-forming methyltransferase MnmC